MAINSKTPVERGSSNFGNLEGEYDGIAAGTVPAHRLVDIDSNAKVVVAVVGSGECVGVNAEDRQRVSGDSIQVGWGKCVVTAGDVISPGDAFKVGDGGKALRFVDTEYASAAILAATAGVEFTNQPANDGLEIGSASAADTTQTVTVYGTTTGTDTVVVETITLTGTTFVSTVKVDWGVILGVSKSAATAGTVTVREASGNATVTAGLTAAVLSVGMTAVPAGTQQAYNRIPTIVAAGASTKQVGLIGTNSAGTTIYDSKALAGTTVTAVNTAFNRVTFVLLGDVAAASTAAVGVTATVDDPKLNLGKTLSAATAADQLVAALLFPR